MKVLFLDIDGVLRIDFESHIDLIDQSLILNLQHVIKETGIKIVLSSDWRRKATWLKLATDQLGFFGIKIFDTTPIHLSRKLRWQEIQEWLDEHEDIEKFAVLDDDTGAMIPDQAETFFFTDYDLGGLNLNVVEQLIQYFNN